MRDASSRYHSVDTPYYFPGQNHHGFRAIVAHKAQSKDEWSFEQGDILGTKNYTYNAYNIGDLNANNISRKYPRLKVEEYVQDIHFKGLDFF